MRHAALPGLAAAFAALALAAPAAADPSRPQIDAFIAAVEAIGCVVETDAQAAAVEVRTGFDDGLLSEIVNALFDSGEATLGDTGEGLRLTTPACR